jgi:hypothetical protein
LFAVQPLKSGKYSLCGSGAVSLPQAFYLAAFVRITGIIAIGVFFILLDAPDNVGLFHVCRFDASLFCDFPELLHFHDYFAPLE